CTRAAGRGGACLGRGAAGALRMGLSRRGRPRAGPDLPRAAGGGGDRLRGERYVARRGLRASRALRPGAVGIALGRGGLCGLPTGRLLDGTAARDGGFLLPPAASGTSAALRASLRRRDVAGPAPAAAPPGRG